MNFFSVLVSFVLLASGAVFAEQNKSKKLPAPQPGPVSPCSKKLESIVYYPQLPAFNYLEKVMRDFQQSAQFILSQLNSGNRGPLGEFMNKYQARVLINDGFDAWNIFVLGPLGQAVPVNFPTGYPYMFHSQAQAMLTGVSYGYNPDLNFYEVTFVLQASDAIVSLVSISVSASTVFGF